MVMDLKQIPIGITKTRIAFWEKLASDEVNKIRKSNTFQITKENIKTVSDSSLTSEMAKSEINTTCPNNDINVTGMDYIKNDTVGEDFKEKTSNVEIKNIAVDGNLKDECIVKKLENEADNENDQIQLTVKFGSDYDNLEVSKLKEPDSKNCNIKSEKYANHEDTKNQAIQKEPKVSISDQVTKNYVNNKDSKDLYSDEKLVILKSQEKIEKSESEIETDELKNKKSEVDSSSEKIRESFDEIKEDKASKCVDIHKAEIDDKNLKDHSNELEDKHDSEKTIKFVEKENNDIQKGSDLYTQHIELSRSSENNSTNSSNSKFTGDTLMTKDLMVKSVDLISEEITDDFNDKNPRTVRLIPKRWIKRKLERQRQEELAKKRKEKELLRQKEYADRERRL